MSCYGAPCRSTPLVILEGAPQTQNTYKREDSLKDAQSTGRKRAAVLYPLDPEAPCEWQSMANVGGGQLPIIGCLDGIQKARHHGPDKSVINNDEGNVWRICNACHSRWHAANNKLYNWNTTVFEPHNPRPMDEKEKMEAFKKVGQVYVPVTD